ncbi:MAG: hypothetical protein SOI44_03295 [Lactimicrobium sp.]|jgi:hypothetical protein|uniref:hypothetical protein n=1 Tax=Lactimicrobium sp. TaxID=2563780 RepID=UPI002F356A25
MSKLANEYSQFLEQRKKIEGDIDYDTDPVIGNIVSLMTSDVPATINFLKNECTEEQFIWLSEVFDEIVQKTQSKEMIQVLRQLTEKYPAASKKYNIKFFIDSAADHIEKK